MRNYVSRLYRKLDLNDRAQLAVFLDHTEPAHAGRTDSIADNESSVRGQVTEQRSTSAHRCGRSAGVGA